MTFQDVGQEADFAVQLLIGNRDDITRFPLEDEGRLIAQRSVQVTVQAIDAGVDFSADKPLREGRFPDADFFPEAEPT